ncbi:hypothetical protein IYY11_04185 [Methylocystis sp. H62]|nr:hypothetical protein [Methylocystis sp. H62]
MFKSGRLRIFPTPRAQYILGAIRNRWPWVKHLFTDGAYGRRKLINKAAFKEFVIEIVRRIDADPGFKVLPRRWGRRANLRLDDPLAAPSPVKNSHVFDMTSVSVSAK